MSIAAYELTPPLSDQITPYDESHFVTYLRLLDADIEGADWREAVHIIFEIDPAAEPERAKQVHDSHFARAKWMTEKGYALLLEKHRQGERR
jgi:predicted secreted protein